MRKPFWSDCGLLDVLVAKIVANRAGGTRHAKFFSKGWGDDAENGPGGGIEAVHKRRDQYYEQVRAGNVTFRLREDNSDIEWKNADSKMEKEIQVDEGSFQSPLHDMMPDECKRCHFHLVQPKKLSHSRHQAPSTQSKITSNQQQQPLVYVIMLASTGEVGRKPRLAMARTLAKKHGYASVIVSTPFYGRRKPPGQASFYLDTVSDMWKQYGGVVQEAAALAEYFLSRDPKCKVCFTGFSAGACLSICASWTCMLGYRFLEDGGSRIGVAAHGAPASAGVFATGCVQHLVDWPALRAEPFEDRETTRMRLFNELDLLSVREALALRDPMGTHNQVLRSMRCTGAIRDLISPRLYAQVLEQQLSPLLFHDCKFQWLPGGHVHAYMIRPKFQIHMIVEAVKPLLEDSSLTIRTANTNFNATAHPSDIS